MRAVLDECSRRRRYEKKSGSVSKSRGGSVGPRTNEVAKLRETLWVGCRKHLDRWVNVMETEDLIMLKMRRK
jgi:hypothetical protein